MPTARPELLYDPPVRLKVAVPPTPTITVAAMLPAARLYVPPESQMLPVPGFTPVVVSVPLPVLTSLDAAPPLMAPEKRLEELVPPTVRVCAPSATLPSPASALTVWSKPLRSSVAPETTERAEAAGMALV